MEILLFTAYSHRDELLRDELEKHLSMLKRTGVIEVWHDRRIGAGGVWEHEIDDNLRQAAVILLLVSSDFLASDYCYQGELQVALERHARGEARVIPVILRACEWQHPPLAALQALPRDARPVTSWEHQDEAFADIARGVREAVEEMTGGHPPEDTRRAEAISDTIENWQGQSMARFEAVTRERLPDDPLFTWRLDVLLRDHAGARRPAASGSVPGSVVSGARSRNRMAALVGSHPRRDRGLSL